MKVVGPCLTGTLFELFFWLPYAVSWEPLESLYRTNSENEISADLQHQGSEMQGHIKAGQSNYRVKNVYLLLCSGQDDNSTIRRNEVTLGVIGAHNLA